MAESVASEATLLAAILHTNRRKVRNETPISPPLEIVSHNSVFGPVGIPTGPACGTWDTSHGLKKGLYNFTFPHFGVVCGNVPGPKSFRLLNQSGSHQPSRLLDPSL